MNRAYSLLTIKSIDDSRHVLTGTATTPRPDRIGDVIEPLGAKFLNPSPLLLFHDSTKPVGTVRFKKPTDDGIEFEATLPQIEEPGVLQDRVREAWQSVKAGLIKGVSIGFRVLDDGIELLRSGGVRFTKIEILELSLVAVPANAEATIATIKSLAASDLAASGDGRGLITPGVSGTPAAKAARAKSMTNQEKKIAFEAEKAAKVAKMNELMSGEDAGATLDPQKQQDFDDLDIQVKSIDEHLSRLETLERVNKAAAKPAVGDTLEKAAASRDPQRPVITVRDNMPPGIAFARKVMCQVQARLDSVNVADVAKQRYPDHSALHDSFVAKGDVPAGTSTQTVWAGPLVYANTLESEFIEFLRPMTILGKFGTGGVPSLRRVPFNVRFASQTSGGTGYWVGQGAPKPLTSFAFSATTLGYTKVAAISVITEELARFSTPSAETLVRDALAGALIERIDIDFIDPTSTAVANVQPASITSGLVALSSAGTSADNVRTDLGKIIGAFVAANLSTASLVLIMPNSLALVLSIMVNSLGQPEFPGLTSNGGSLNGIPVITSQYAANSSGAGNLVIAVAASELFLADDGQVRVDASREASLQMLDNPTNNSATATATTMVSMYQTNSIALRAERFINWAKRRSDAVVYMDDVNWGSVGSPA
jgi:HK97 family phage major capsid protein/HK97 family phage prohead protease